MVRDVTLDVAGIPHRVIGTHWENDGTPDASHPDRVASGARAVGLLEGDMRPVFLAGDLNAHRDQDEVRLLADAGLEEACPVRPVPVAAPHKCSTIDLIFTRGPYRVTAYRHSWVLPEDTRDPTHPSDHPFVLATYERTAYRSLGGHARLRVRGRRPTTRKSGSVLAVP
jgi:endonuclease/exonuclease/phosphatase (EEP) superfamily protein YafD